MVTITIIMNDNGTLNINAPMENKVLCYGMLELAKEVIHKQSEINERMVQPVTLDLVRKHGS